MTDTNLLMIHQGALGDFILTFPAITRLRQYYRPIDVLCQKQLGKLASALGLAENWYPSEAAYVASLYSDPIDHKMSRLLRGYENVIVFTLSDQLERSISRITPKLSCRLPPKPPPHQRIHVAQFILEHLLDSGLITAADANLDDIPLPSYNDRPQNPRRILLHPGAGSIRKRWPLSNFLQIEAALKTDKFTPEFVLGPAETDLAEALRHSDRMVTVLDDLLDLLDLFNAAGGYIGNDSGASHLAAYSGLPTVVIFGPADPRRWAPVGRAVHIVHPELQCRPCFETETSNCEDPWCLAATRPQKVLEAFYRVYSN